MKGFTQEWLDAREKGEEHTPKTKQPVTGPGGRSSSPRPAPDPSASTNTPERWQDAVRAQRDAIDAVRLSTGERVRITRDELANEPAAITGKLYIHDALTNTDDHE